MSGQASRSRVLAVQRHRRHVARAIAEVELEATIVCGMCQGSGEDDDTLELEPLECSMCEGTGSGRHALMLALLSDPGQGFDVHALREHARSLIALEAEQGAFEDWTREQGLGPENRERYAFKSSARIYWTPDGGPVVHERHERGGWPGKLARSWHGDRRAPMGRSLARLGRRIDDALEGQPSECGHWTANDGQTMRTVIVAHVPTVIPCGCHGTGHNLRGVLPPIEWSPAVRRKVGDGMLAAGVWDDVREWSRLADWYGTLPYSSSRPPW